ncbi:MAG: HAD hydrolase family protein [Actinomycetota bacterium]
MEVDALDSLEIDETADLVLARLIASTRELGLPGFSGVRAIVTDFDGVHTDDRAVVDENGLESAVVSRSDGMGVGRARRTGLPMLILSTERAPIVERRAEKLGVDCISGCDDKVPELERWLREQSIDPADVVYVGNDVNDLGCLQLVGHPVIVADAHPTLLQEGFATTARSGGDGALREVLDAVLSDLGG